MTPICQSEDLISQVHSETFKQTDDDKAYKLQQLRKRYQSSQLVQNLKSNCDEDSNNFSEISKTDLDLKLSDLASTTKRKCYDSLLNKYRMIINSKSKTKVNRMYQILKSCNGNYDAAKETENHFTFEEMKIIYELRKNRENSKQFAPDEDELLCVKVNLIGPHFGKLVKYFHNKTASDLKRRYMKIKNLNNLLPFNNFIEGDQTELNQPLEKDQEEKSSRINQNNFESFLNRKKGQSGTKSQAKPAQIMVQNSKTNLQFISQILYQNSKQETKSSLRSEAETDIIINSIESKLIEDDISKQESTTILNIHNSSDEFIDLPPHKPLTIDNQTSTLVSFGDKRSRSRNNLSNKEHPCNAIQRKDSDSFFKNCQPTFKFFEDEKHHLSSDDLFKFSYKNFSEEDICNDEERIKLMRNCDTSTMSEFSNNISEINHQLEEAKLHSNANYLKFDDFKLSSLLNGKMKFETVNNTANSTYFKVISSSNNYSAKFSNKLQHITKKEIYDKSLAIKSQIDSSFDYLCKVFIELENTVQTKLLDLIEEIKKSSISSSDIIIETTQCRQDLMTLNSEIDCLINKKFDLITRMITFLQIKVIWLNKLNEIY